MIKRGLAFGMSMLMVSVCLVMLLTPSVVAKSYLETEEGMYYLATPSDFIDPKSLAMGGTTVTVPGQMAVGISNPAKLAWENNYMVNGSISFGDGVSTKVVEGIVPKVLFDKLQFSYLFVDGTYGIDKFSYKYQESYKAITGCVGGDRFSFGISFPSEELYQRTYDTGSGSSTSTENGFVVVGFAGRIGSRFSYGMVLLDKGVSGSMSESPIPFEFIFDEAAYKLGVAYTYQDWILSIDTVNQFIDEQLNENKEFRFGSQFPISHGLLGRLGMQINGNKEFLALSTGVGYKQDEYTVNAAFSKELELDKSIISLGVDYQF